MISDTLSAVTFDLAKGFDLTDTAFRIVVLIAGDKLLTEMESLLTQTDAAIVDVFLADLILHAAACEVRIKCFVAFHDYLLFQPTFNRGIPTVLVANTNEPFFESPSKLDRTSNND